MKDQNSIFLGNSLSYPSYKKTRRNKGWKWFALAAVGAAVTALGYVGS
jgi:hypothetical protein